MLHHTKTLYGKKLAARDGVIGHVADFYFDDQNWVIRYLVAETGSWLTGRLVLISPHAFGKLDPTEKTFPVTLRMKQIEESPPIDRHQPVSRQYEIEYYTYYGWPAYWDGGGLWGQGGYPVLIPPLREENHGRGPLHHRDDQHLQSALAVTGYEIAAADGAIGKVNGLLVDDTDWAIRGVVVETGHWLSGRLILVTTDKVIRISYPDSRVEVSLTKADIERTKANEIVKVADRVEPLSAPTPTSAPIRKTTASKSAAKRRRPVTSRPRARANHARR